LNGAEDGLEIRDVEVRQRRDATEVRHVGHRGGDLAERRSAHRREIYRPAEVTVDARRCRGRAYGGEVHIAKGAEGGLRGLPQSFGTLDRLLDAVLDNTADVRDRAVRPLRPEEHT